MTTFLDTTGDFAPQQSNGYRPGDFVICRPPGYIPQHVFRVMRGGSDPIFSVFNGYLAQSAVAVSLTGTTAETVLASVTVPAQMMGPNGSLRITPIWSVTNNANSKTANVKFGGTIHSSPALASAVSASHEFVIRNRGTLNSQISFSGAPGTNSASANATSSINTALDQVVQITGQLANASDTLVLEGYTVELIPG